MVFWWLCGTAYLVGVGAVITSQGMGGRWAGGDEDGDNEVREFKGWITGDKDDYFMSLQSLLQHQKKIAGQSPNLDLFSPGIRNDYESFLTSSTDLANLTYKKGMYHQNLASRVKCQKQLITQLKN